MGDIQDLSGALCLLQRMLPLLARTLQAASFHIGQYVCSARAHDFGTWLLCDGRSLDRERYAELFAVIGTSFGGGASTFCLPDFRGRVMGAVGTGDGLSVRALGDKLGSEMHALTSAEIPSHVHSGTVDAAGTHAHGGTTSTAGSHTHDTNAGGGSLGLAVADGTNTVIDTDASAGELNVWTTPAALVVNAGGSHSHAVASDGSHTHTFTTGSTGGGTAHPNMQPTLFAGNVFIFSGVIMA